MARVPYVTKDDLDEADHRYIVSQRPRDEISEEYAHLMSDSDVRHFYATLANRLPILRAFRELQTETWEGGGLDPFERELVILTVARSLDAGYEWHQHVRVALGEPESLSAEEIVALSEGRLDGFDPAHAALSRYVAEFVTGAAGVEEGTHDALAEHYDEGTIVGIAVLAALYALVARVGEAFAIEIEPGEEFVGWRLENV